MPGASDCTRAAWAPELPVQGPAAEEDLRPEIAASWWRSQLLGVEPELPIEAIPGDALLDADERLRRAVEPVLDELATKLAGTNAAILLADHRAVILDRRIATRAAGAEMDRLNVIVGNALREGCVGTNAIGTAVEERRLIRVAGDEHFIEIFKHLSCYGVPLVHPLTRRLVGVLDLTFPPREEHPLMRSFMTDAGRRIEGALAEWASLRERAQFQCFLSLGRQTRRPVVSTMDGAVLLNRGARELNPVDQAALLRAAADAAESNERTISVVLSGDDQSTEVRVHTHNDEARFPGVVLEVAPSTRRRTTPRATPPSLPALVGAAGAWVAFCEQARHAATRTTSILLVGEQGTGKFAAARSLHQLSGRRRLVVVDVATALADGRPAWLHELRGGLEDTQATVLIRHLDHSDRRLAAGIAAEIDRATDLDARLIGTLTTGSRSAGLESLLSRFCSPLHVPPLRDRRDDIPVLVRHFVNRHEAERRLWFHPETLATLRAAEFPDNVRELETIVAGVAGSRRSGDVLPVDLPSVVLGGPAHLSPMECAERRTIVQALREVNGNKAAAAVVLGISRATLYRKLSQYRIELT